MPELKKYQMFIDGQWVDSDTKKTFETLNPENNKPWAVVPEASANDVDRAVKAAQKAFEGEWPKMLARDRAKYLRAIGNKLRENSELLGKIETIDTEKLYRETYQQAKYIAEYYDYYAGLADKVEGTVLPIDKPNIQAITTRIPIGVIAAIIPWNSQMFLTATKVAPALAMGNTVVIKCSELAPATMFEFAKLVEETGIPKGVLNVVSGFGDPCGKALTTHNLVEKVAFTGGPETARHIIRNSAENLSEVSLELGGKIKCGGKRHPFSNEGYYFPPTIIECDNHNLPAAENELFGPVLSVMKFDTEKEVIELMNDNQYGLSSGVYTSDLARGMRVSNAIRAGITFVNTYRLISPSAPFGGIKDSGYGKEAGIDSIKDYTRVKTTWFYTSDEPSLDPFSIR